VLFEKTAIHCAAECVGWSMHVRPVGNEDAAEWMRMRDALWSGLAARTHETEMADFRSDQTTQAVFVVDRGNGVLGGFLETGTRHHADG
jgi:aminoglycoside 6'-N-acetyltransferase I